MSLHRLEIEVIRNDCRRIIENLEIWLRQLIHNSLAPLRNDYLRLQLNDQPVFSRKIRDVQAIQEADLVRFRRPIDAASFEDTIAIITNQTLYNAYFSGALKRAFPQGREECRTFLDRLKEPRNKLSHANPISIREAERVLCYSNDVISSIKEHYREINMEHQFNAPTIVSYRDSEGRQFSVGDFIRDGTGNLMLWNRNLVNGTHNVPRLVLRSGDIVTFEVDIDPSFGEDTYTVTWQTLSEGWGTGKHITRVLSVRDVAQHVVLWCSVVSNKDWHRLGGSDDVLYVHLAVLPPLE